jgi:phosphoserine/homoserine phosphotransferase
MIVCLDLEGVLVPEIWIAVAKETKVAELRLTTRDIPDYDVLMKRRIGILKKEGIKLRDIQRVIAKIKPLPGAKKFLDRLRLDRQVIILSDTFYEFAGPLMKQLGDPTIFCNRLDADPRGFVSGYRLRQPDGKKKSVLALKSLGFTVKAAGDSYNDLTMLKTADKGVFFNPPDKIAAANPRIPVTKTYDQLFRALS